VLVVDLDTLGLVDPLDLGNEVQLGRRRALEPQQLGRRQRALVKGIARLDLLPRRDEQPRAPWELVARRLLTVGGVDEHLRPSLGLLDLDLAALFDELGRTLRAPSLEDLDDARETVRDVGAGDTAGVERPHRQLRARLADRLRGDDPDRVADLGHPAGGEEEAVARTADTELAAALEH
jgi:hypothetical protein